MRPSILTLKLWGSFIVEVLSHFEGVNMAKGKRKKSKETGRKKKREISLAVWLSIVLVLLFLMIAPIIMTLDFFAYWDQGNGPFILIFIREVFLTGIWGLVCLIFGLFVSIGSIYMIVTKKAHDPKGLILPGILLTVISLGLAYGFLGFVWDDFVKDAIMYKNHGPSEKVIVLEEYEVDRDYGKFSGPTDYLYTSENEETFTTQTIFPVDLVIGEKYKIQYLPKTRYLVGIEKAE